MQETLFEAYMKIDDLDMTPDEIWAGVTYFNKLGQDGEAALLAAGLGLEKYLDIRMDAEDREADIHGGAGGDERYPAHHRRPAVCGRCAGARRRVEDRSRSR